METEADFIFLGSKITADGDCSHEIKRRLLLGRNALKKLRQHIKKQRHYWAGKGLSSQSYGFPRSHEEMWELDHKKGWVPKKFCFQLVVLEKTLESSLDSKEIKPANPKGNQPLIFIGKADDEAEAAILWTPDVKKWLIEKDPVAGKEWRQKQKWMAEDGMVR